MREYNVSEEVKGREVKEKIETDLREKGVRDWI